MRFDYDLFVIGGGSGGVRAARVAALEAGATVGLAEEDRYGGTCVIRGCVPKKLMVFASEYSSMVSDAQNYGWAVQTGKFDWQTFKKHLHAELDRLEGVYLTLLKNSGVTCYDQQARLVNENTIELEDGTRRTAKFILIATGGRPTVPKIPGAELAANSDDIFHLKELPESILIVGGGYIASEFAGVMNGLGVQTTQFYRGEQILRGFDNEARNLIGQEMRHSGIDLRLNTQASDIRKEGDVIRVKTISGEELNFDVVLYATGRAPNSENMGLQDVGVERGCSGEILVDEFSQTSVPSIFAIGDVTDRINLTPVAIREGMAFVETVFKNRPTPVDHELIPTAVFTSPEFGSVGLSEEDAALKEAVDVYSTTFTPMRQSFAGRTLHALMKLVVSKKSRKVLGCHIVAPGASEIIQLAAVAIKMGATKDDFDRTVAVHPTSSEEIVTIRKPVRSHDVPIIRASGD